MILSAIIVYSRTALQLIILEHSVMTAQLIDGKIVAKKILAETRDVISVRTQQGLRPPGLAVILVGDDPASHIYVRNKRRACEETGIQSVYHPLPASTTEKKIIELIQQLNAASIIDGILLQLPLPPHIDSNKLLELIHPAKDVDGFHPYNLGRLAQRRPLLRPCTPYGIITLLDSIQETYRNRHAVIVGASNIVGRPMLLELLLAGSTVTLCHRLTQDIQFYVSQADILVSAVGQPGLIQGNWIKSGATVIDVGINRLADGSIKGDVEFDTACEKAAWITPVPGGVGPMTIAILMKNTLMAASHFTIHPTQGNEAPFFY
jgi:methylenetetrahydrofolate dehydrogenase (NADP+)/methenyltetrahydrofolate cyclohydrolase